MAKHFKDPEFLKQLDQTRRHRGQKTMTVHEVSSHCTREDLFIIVDNVVYDVTKFQKEHPGGVLSILEVAGKEATEVFLAENHSRYAVVSKLSQCYIADLDTRGVKMSETDPATGEPQSNQTITEPNASPSLPPSCPDVKRLSATAVNKIFSDHAEMFALPGMAWLVREHGCSSMVGACGVRSKKLAGAEGAEEEQRGSEGRKEGGNQASEEAALSGEEVFHWGSCSKALTATLILILIQDPSVPLEWETQVGHALPQLALPPDMAAITVRQLLTHRSGLHADLGGAGADDGNAGKRAEEALSKTTAGLSPTQSRVEYVKMMAKIELAHVPGSRYGPYSNAGYTILGAVAEAVTGDGWEELVQVRVAKPLGMGSLGFGFPRGEIRAHDEEGVPAPAEAEDVPWHAPAYTCHATLSDWDKFARVHLAALRGEPGAGEGFASSICWSIFRWFRVWPHRDVGLVCGVW